MFIKKCRCGLSQRNFKVDIGEFFIAECCEDAGFDNLGNKKIKESPKLDDKPKKRALRQKKPKISIDISKVDEILAKRAIKK